MRNSWLARGVAATAILGAPAFGQGFSEARDGLESQAEEAMAVLEDIASTNGIPGLSASVWIDDGVAWSGGVGYASLELQAPVTRETKFRMASVTKLLTASLAAKLAESGEVDLDADIRQYVEEFPEESPTVTLRMLLGHLGGIRHYARSDFDPSAPGSIIDFRMYPDTNSKLALFINDDLVATPGEEYSYTTFGYTLIGAALARATETPFHELLQEQLLDPLELHDIVADDMRAIIPGRTSLYDNPQPMLREQSGSGIKRAMFANTAYKRAGGGFLSTPDDLVRFAAAHFEAGFFEQATLDEMFTRQTTTAGEEITVGLGWRIAKDSSDNRVLHHSGNMGGARSTLVVWPEKRFAVSMMSNLSGTPDDVVNEATRLYTVFNSK